MSYHDPTQNPSIQISTSTQANKSSASGLIDDCQSDGPDVNTSLLSGTAPWIKAESRSQTPGSVITTVEGIKQEDTSDSALSDEFRSMNVSPAADALGGVTIKLERESHSGFNSKLPSMEITQEEDDHRGVEPGPIAAEECTQDEDIQNNDVVRNTTQVEADKDREDGHKGDEDGENDHKGDGLGKRHNEEVDEEGTGRWHDRYNFRPLKPKKRVKSD